MNILVFSWRDPKHPLAGGAEQVMDEHMEGWIEAGNKVTLFSSKVVGLPSEETLDGIRIIRKGDQYLGVKIAAFFFWLKNNKDYDFIVDQFHGIPFFTPLYINKPKLAVLQEVASQVWFLNEFPAPFNWVVGLLGYLFEPAIFLFYRKVPFMVGSESAKEGLIKFGIPAKNIAVVSHGVIIKKPDPFPKKEKTKTIMYLGALAKDKGIEDALKCFSLLEKKTAASKLNFQYWVVGKGSAKYRDYLYSLCKTLGISAKVKFWGFVSQERKFYLLAKSHLLVNPSVHEGWGLVNIEANAMGTPIVAYNSAGLTDSVKNGYSGVIVKKDTSEELSLAVQNLLTDNNKYEKMQADAILWSKNFSWQKSKKLSLNKIIDIMRTNEKYK